jgi:hypothetical protein
MSGQSRSGRSWTKEEEARLLEILGLQQYSYRKTVPIAAAELHRSFRAIEVRLNVLKRRDSSKFLPPPQFENAAREERRT